MVADPPHMRQLETACWSSPTAMLDVCRHDGALQALPAPVMLSKVRCVTFAAALSQTQSLTPEYAADACKRSSSCLLTSCCRIRCVLGPQPGLPFLVCVVPADSV